MSIFYEASIIAKNAKQGCKDHYWQIIRYIATKKIFRELNWQSLAGRWEKNKLIFMHKVKSTNNEGQSIYLSLALEELKLMSS